MPTADELKQRIEAAIPGATAAVESPDDVHFSAHVAAPAFAGKSRVQQHQLVYEALKGQMGGALHALSLQTGIPNT